MSGMMNVGSSVESRLQGIPPKASHGVRRFPMHRVRRVSRPFEIQVRHRIHGLDNAGPHPIPPDSGEYICGRPANGVRSE